MILQESSQVGSSSGGSLVLIRPQDVVTEDCNRIDSSLSSVQTMETDSGLCETEGKTPPAELFKQDDKSNRPVSPVTNIPTIEEDHIDEQSCIFQETVIAPSLTNSNTVTVGQQEVTKDKEELPVDQYFPQGQPMNQDQQPMDEHNHSMDQHVCTAHHDTQSMDVDVQSINQDNESIDQKCQEKHSLDQDSEGHDNPFSQLLLFSDSDDTVPLKKSKKKWRKTKSEPPARGRRKKTERKTPDSFVAVRFSSPELRQRLEVVQQHMVEMDKKLKPTLIPLVKLHTTVMTLQLNNDASLTAK